ncbi:hypothetical protein [Streptomyces liliifuscus]|uniref:Uncharacterized protein n=1 Tax=Streptomyces liliifuscus TaxID=2797636 RepID=A0A7T7L1C6_9ACTN|nr:hypothetical protein [Streptomyces liliifuscus]QQM44576.1 hypothetical protein JEQ17_37675 [Streptomyces liliifuscus]
MAAVITKESTIECLHKSAVSPVGTAVSDVLVVAGEAALIGTLETSPIPGCPRTSAPCTAVSSQTAGASTVLFAADRPVLLSTATGRTSSGTWSVTDAGQNLLTAD